ncbi:Protein TANC2 [Colletotrichum shisoi]|uniref:Protein TANC2 n=1 Tax=Colletotrichum shisoi TaxID=2078593 RepID=A0A5Q4C1G8_9PEZI|nr:Protein TANC2 [Colletotrichum shisoi]
MSLSKRAAKDAQWLQYRPTIQQMILDDKAQEEIRQSLEDNGFRVTKHQLEYKLRIWDIRKRLPKTRSEAVWQYTDARLLKREAEGKTSEVIIDGKIVNSAKVRKERSRYQRSTLARYTQPIQTPQTPEEMRISICTPPPMPMQFSWPKSLPWLQFEAKLLQVLHYPTARGSKRNAIQQSAKPLEPTFLRSLGLSIANPVKNVALLAAELGSFMPETQEGDNINRAQLILQGSSNEASHEYVKAMIYRLSNNFDNREMDGREDIDAWNQSLELLQAAGITSIPLQVDETTDVTVAALVEKLFRIRAVEHGDLEVLKRLVVMPRLKLCQAWLDEVPLVLAVGKRNLSMVAVLLDAGEDVNEIPCEYPWCSPLRAAIGRGNLDMINLLLQAGADVNETPYKYTWYSPLHTAIDRGNLDMVILLLKAGADVNKIPCKYSRRSPLQAAVERGNLDMINLILKEGADVNSPALDEEGATALQLAAIKGLLGVARTLIDKGADVNAYRAKTGGRTALEGAAEHGRIDMVHFLLDQGLQTYGKGQVQYLRAIKLAEEKGHLAAAKMLRGYRDWTADDHRLWDRLQSLQEELAYSMGFDEEWWDHAQEDDFADKVYSDSDSEEVDYEETSSDASEEDLELPDAEDEGTLSEYTSSDVVVEDLPSGSETAPSAMAIDDPAASPESYAADQHGFWNGDW